MFHQVKITECMFRLYKTKYKCTKCSIKYTDERCLKIHWLWKKACIFALAPTKQTCFTKYKGEHGHICNHKLKKTDRNYFLEIAFTVTYSDDKRNIREQVLPKFAKRKNTFYLFYLHYQ